MSRFLDAHSIEVTETTPASRKLGKADAARLAREAKEIFVAKGKQLDRFEGGTPTEEIVAKMLGPTGNLRSPTIRVGKTVVIGFDQRTLEKVLL